MTTRVPLTTSWYSVRFQYDQTCCVSLADPDGLLDDPQRRTDWIGVPFATVLGIGVRRNGSTPVPIWRGRGGGVEGF